MSSKPKKLLVLTSGGDAPGMNAAIRAVVRTAIHNSIEVFGCEAGYQGLVDERIIPLHPESVANCIQRGGTLLQTGRFEAFSDKTVRNQALSVLDKRGIDAIVVIGGDGSFRGAALLAQEGGLKTVGIPCTIDNDIVGTDYTIGFDTACNTALQSIDRVRDTASSHCRNFLVEVMGRSSGFLAVDVGIAGGAEYILIPEVPLDIERLVQRMQERRRKKIASIIVVAEADDPGRSVEIAAQIKEIGGYFYRVCILGHTQRGGSPTVEDRKVASLMGAHAVQALLEGQSSKMVAMQCGKCVYADFPDPKLGPRRFSDKELLHMNEVLCDV